MESNLLNNKAPEFNLLDKDNAPYALKQFLGKKVVLFFYPKDDTPGCTIESKAFSGIIEQFKKINCEVIGISGGGAKTKTKFCNKYDLKLLMLSDTDFSVSKNYQSYGEKSFMGIKSEGILRKTFVIDEKGILVKIFDKVKVEEHAEEVLGFILSAL